MTANNLSQFEFSKIGSGEYGVVYTTGRGDYYVARINDMPIIDNTLHAERAKLRDIKTLVRLCKGGVHYNKRGEKIKKQ